MNANFRTIVLSCALLTTVALPSLAQTLGDYTYDASGNVQSIGPDSDGVTSFYDYDSSGRLIRFVRKNAAGTALSTETYEYDSYGNQTKQTTNGAVTTQTANANTNRLNAATYDAAGNMLTYGAETYVFDPVGTLSKKSGSWGSAFYVYTANDERIGIEGPDLSWRYMGRDLDGKVLREWSAPNGTATTWTWVEDYVYRDGQLAAAVRPTSEGGVRHFHLDHLGTPRLITNSSATVYAAHTYYPFGRELTSPTQELALGHDTPEPMKFTGHERDFAGSYTGPVLDYMHARYYNPQAGRFLSVDPKLNVKRALNQPQSWNRYSYVMNNPLKYTDPTGEDVSIRVTFMGNWSEEDKKRILAQVKDWYQKQNVGNVYVFDGAKASEGGNFFSRFSNSGAYTSIKVSAGQGPKHTSSTVFAGNYADLPTAQRLTAIANSIIHETVAHQFGATLGNQFDFAWYARDHAYRKEDAINSRYGTVADSWAFADPKTRSSVTDGPIPIDPEDRKTLQGRLGPLHVEPPDYDQ